MVESIAGLGSALDATADPAKNKMKDAAQQFESLMIAQLLKSAHNDEAGGGWLGTGDDQTGQTAVGFAEQQFATMLSKSGGIGLTRFIEHGLQKDSSHASHGSETETGSAVSLDPGNIGRGPR